MKKLWLYICCMLLTVGTQAQSIKFNRTYGGGYFDEATGVALAHDSGYVVCGATSSFSNELTDVLLLKVDTLGDEQWLKYFGWEGSDKAYDIKDLGPNGFILTGTTDNGENGFDMFFAKTDANGDTLFAKKFGGSDWDLAYSVDTTFDQGYLIAGETYSYGAGNSDGYIIKLDANGDTVWTKVLGGPEEDVIRMVFESYDSTIFAIGSTRSFGAGAYDVWLIALDSTGDTLFTKTYGTAENEYGYSIDDYFDNSNNPYLMAGTSFYAPQSGLMKPRMCRLALDGFLVINLDFIDPSNDQYEDRIMVRKKRNYRSRFYYSGQHKFAADDENYNMKISVSGNSGYYENTFLVPNVANQTATDVIEAYDSGYLLCGYTDYYGPGTQAVVLVKLDSQLNAVVPVTVDTKVYTASEGISLFPNPVQDQLHVMWEDCDSDCSITIRDMQGKVLYVSSLGEGIHYIPFTGLSTGVYLAEFVRDGERYYAKILKE